MKDLIIGFKMILVMTLLVGLIYPLSITFLAEALMSEQARGSLVIEKDKIIGSALIGQKFEKDIYFWPRPSAVDYNPLRSGGSNLGPTSRELQELVNARIQKLNVEPSLIPAEMVYSSASGVDPHISIAAAYFQIKRIAKARNISNEARLKYFIDYTAMESTGAYVNVLKLNLGLDRQFPVMPAGSVNHER